MYCVYCVFVQWWSGGVGALEEWCVLCVGTTVGECVGGQSVGVLDMPFRTHFIVSLCYHPPGVPSHNFRG